MSKDDGLARRVRAVIRGPIPRSALVQVNTRVCPGHPTIMLPGGGIAEGETPLQALQRELWEECGISVALDSTNARLVAVQRYDFKGGEGPSSVELGFYEVHAPGCAPRNMEPDSVIMLDWVTLEEVRRYVGPADQNWRIQLGAMEALEAVLDPARNGQVDDPTHVASAAPWAPPGFGRETGRSVAPAEGGAWERLAAARATDPYAGTN